MKFANWEMVYFIWIVILFAAFFFLRKNKKILARQKFAELKLIPSIVNRLEPKKDSQRIILLTLAGIFSALMVLLFWNWAKTLLGNNPGIKRETLDTPKIFRNSKRVIFS